ncbi:MAG: hypothetical protein Q9185_004444 [Variospora sp. 1 TL-2023]
MLVKTRIVPLPCSVAAPHPLNLDTTTSPFIAFLRQSTVVPGGSRQGFGRSIDFNTLAYLGPLDLLYHIAFLPSHRNRLEAHVSLLDAVNCQILLVSDNEPFVVARILHERPTKQFRIPSLEYFLQDVEVTAYDYDQTFEEARLSPSGSTGIPKPIVVNHGTLASIDAYHLISYLGGDAVIGPSLKGSKMLMAFPLYHLASFTLLLGYAAYYQIIGVLPPAVEPITAHLVVSILAQADVQGSALPPSLLVDLCHEESYLAILARLHYVFDAGGSLPVEAGDKTSSITKLTTLVGSTEVGYPPMKDIESTDWQYVCYSPFDGHVFRPLADDGLYEHFLVRRDYLNLFQGIFSTYPALDEFPTQDVYRKQPTQPGLWRFAGRMDDVIVFSNAEKFYPGDFEDTISSHPAVRTTMMGGHREFQSFLLIEPMQAGDEANKTIPTHARVVKDFILFTRPEKPVEHAGKGTVQRTATLRLYLEEIASLYKVPEMPKIDPHQIVQSELQQASTLREVLNSLFSKSVEYDGRIKDDTDFFDLALDSLQTLALSKKINAYLIQADAAAPTVTPNTIYAHSSIGRLTSALEFTSDPLLQRSDRQRMQQIFDQCSSLMAPPRQSPPSTHKKRAVVLLTGSTGSLGSYVLDALIQHRGIEKIYCLDWSKGTEARQTSSSETRGLSSDWQSVRFLTCDLGHQRLGLDSDTYDELSKEITHVVHNAWDVNFKRSLDSFVNLHITGVRRMTEFCAYSAHSAHLVFISPESAVLGGIETVVKEEVVQDWSCAQGTGYAKAKLIAERLIDRATRNCQLKSSIVRIGQIAGPTSGKGVCNTQEWFPSMVASSVSMQKLPNELPVKDALDWIPVDAVGKILVELLVESDNEPRSSDERQATKSSAQCGRTRCPRTLSQVVNLIMSLTAKMERAVTGIQEIIGYTFNDPGLVWEAVSAAGSFTSGGNRHFADGNKRLAVLGDTVLQLALAEHWYEGVYDNIRQQVGSNANLSIVGRTANIDAFVNLSGAQRTVAPLTMAVTVEAILGAVYLDSKGIVAVKAVMEKLGLKPA